MPTGIPLRLRMRGRDTDESHRVSSPLELLFDLTFVVAISQIAVELADHIERGHGAATIVPFAMVFFAIWWAWMNFTWFASAYDTDDILYRLLTLLQMGGVLVLAAGVPAAFTNENFLGVTIGYFIMRIALVAQWIRAAVENPDGRATATRYAIGVSVVQVGWLLRLLLPITPSMLWLSVYGSFLILAVLEMAVPFWAERPGMTHWHPHHIAERYGLFTIILLGESVASLSGAVRLIISSGGPTPELITVGVCSLVLIFALWWIYFMQPTGDGLHDHRERSFFWGYAHYVVFGSLAALGGGLDVVVAYAGGHPEISPTVAVYAVAIPVAVYLLSLWIAHAPIVTRQVVRAAVIVPAAVLVLLAPLAAAAIGMPAALAIVVAVAVVAVVITVVLKNAVARGEAATSSLGA